MSRAMTKLAGGGFDRSRRASSSTIVSAQDLVFRRSCGLLSIGLRFNIRLISILYVRPISFDIKHGRSRVSEAGR